ncbi:hypothetical protein LSH36_692g00003 [Paralvinella palmiformis]|uniref:G-protein coupled receptors family 1 profile domain-containing protein n=1 Tax=Paralvinella palmiformis TaxID=53620 RepID=A0AAD9J2R8_9ANNE|nr:hypothetical protein LSH36_692g00003 [Paralvinella palmiformis]
MAATGTSANNTTLLNGTSATCFILNDPPEVVLTHKISLYSCMLFVVVGVIGNALSIVVFTNKNMRTMSSNTYLLALAFSDSLYLVSVFFADVLKNLKCFYFPAIPLDVVNNSSVVCQLSQYFLDLFSDYSTCLILVFTIERFIAVYLPVRFKQLCTLRRARITCIGVFAVIASFIAPYHVLYMGLYTDELGRVYNYCSIKGVEYERPFMILYVTESVLFRIVPVFAIAVVNVFIIVRVTRVSREHRKRIAASGKPNKRTRKEEKNLQLTIMLILVSTSYVLLYLPVLVTFVIDYLKRSEAIEISQHDMLMASDYTRALYVSGFAINFFLYTISGRVFREQLQLILHCTRGRDDRNGYVKSTAETDALTCKHSGDR